MTTLPQRIQATQTWGEARTGREAVAGALVAAREAGEDVVAALRDADLVVWTGAGSSFYQPEAAAWIQREATGRAAVAVPASELILRPAGAVAAGPAAGVARSTVVAFSRSGATSEAVAAIQRANAAGSTTVAITCRPGTRMATEADHVVASPAGDEQAVVMTRSVTSMLTVALRLIARAATTTDGARLAADLDALPGCWAEVDEAVEVAMRIADRRWDRVAVLGGGAAHAIAEEAALKLTETSQIPAQAWHPWEFRHGPQSICEPGVLVVVLAGGPGATEEAALAAEVVRFGATAWLLAPSDVAAGVPADGRIEDGGLVASPLGSGLHHGAQLPALLPPLQALALGVALGRGRDPDAPRQIGAVTTVAGIVR